MIREMKYFFNIINSFKTKIILIFISIFGIVHTIFSDILFLKTFNIDFMNIYFNTLSFYSITFFYGPLFIFFIVLDFKFLSIDSLIVRYKNRKKFFLYNLIFIFQSTIIFNFFIIMPILISLILKTDILKNKKFIINILLQQINLTFILFILAVIAFFIYNFFKSFKVFSFIIPYMIIALDYIFIIRHIEIEIITFKFLYVFSNKQILFGSKNFIYIMIFLILTTIIATFFINKVEYLSN